ncbi:hypothetical protein MBRU_07850 [Mycolicibacterium brumae DSM 44177]|nr:hypothetical protein MBRU_07850 [Mycolicibacterium brumae DSM 44177]
MTERSMTQPSTVRWAGYLVAAEGVAGLVVAGIYIAHALTGENQDVVRNRAGGFGYGTAAWFLIMGAGVLAAGWALVRGRRWGRGIAVLANLILLGVAWYIRGEEQLVWAVLVALAAIAALGLLFTPSAVNWVARPGDAGGPDRS